MRDETEREQPADIAVLGVVPVPALGAWTVRVTIPRNGDRVRGWSPYVFWSQTAGEAWLESRTLRLVRPTVQDCPHGPNDLAYAAVVDDEGDLLLVSEPLPRVEAAGVAALLAAEFRAHARG